MKRMITLLLALILSLSVLSFAAAEADVTGTWYLTEGVADGFSLDASLLGLDWHFTLRADGNCEFYADGDEVTIPWTLSGNLLTLHGVNEPIIVNLEGDQLVIHMDDVALIFTRGQSDSDSVSDSVSISNAPANARANVSQADFQGTWTAHTVEMMGMQLPLENTGMGMEITIDGDSAVSALIEGGERDTVTNSLRYEGSCCIVVAKNSSENDIPLYILDDGDMLCIYADEDMEINFYLSKS